MDWKKKNLLWFFALVGMMIAGTAITITVETEEEARIQLGRAAILEADVCEPLIIEKIVESHEDFSNNWAVTYSMWYFRNGVKTREVGTIYVASNTEQAVKQALEKPCEEKWAEVQAENQTVDKVIIKPTAEQNSVLNQVYDYVRQQWLNVARDLQAD